MRNWAPAVSAARLSWGLAAGQQVPKDGMTQSKVLCRLDEVPEHGAIAVTVPSATGGFELIVLREGDTVFVYHNECPHAGRNLDYAPGEFLVDKGCITCAVHGATFTVTSGACVGGPARSGLVGLPVQVVDGIVCLE